MRIKNLFGILLLLWSIGFVSCEKKEQYASATINGVGYCYKNVDESLPVKGELKLDRYDAASGYYYGS